MSKAILVMGASGSGKTTAMRTLDPKTTFYIDADGKGLSWKGWRKQYCKENKNYVKMFEPDGVMALLSQINEKKPEVKTVVIDTINGIMVGDEMKRARDKGYDKWMDLAQSVYNIVDTSNKLREDLVVVLLGHTQTSEDGFTCLLTNGRKLNKIQLETKLTTVLLAKCVDGQHIFEVKAMNSTAKTPFGFFEGLDSIENDITLVIKELEDF